MKQPARDASRTRRRRSALRPKHENLDEAVLVNGGPVASLVEVRASNVSLVATFGRTQDGRDVLIPLIQWQMFGGTMAALENAAPNDPGPQLSSHLVSLDNLAFLLQDVGYDMRDAVRLVLRSTGEIAMVEGRMRYTARMLRLASKHMSAAAEQLDEQLQSSNDSAELEAPPKTS